MGGRDPRPPARHRGAAATLARRPDQWNRALGGAEPRVEAALLAGLAEEALAAPDEFATVAPGLEARLFDPAAGYAAGCALWRVTWRVRANWLASIDPHGPRFENDLPLLGLVTDVVGEHLGRRPDLATLARALLVRLAADAPQRFGEAVARFVRLGDRGWAVLLPLLGADAPPAVRAAVFGEAAKHPTARRLAHHHAHEAVLARARDRDAVPDEVLAAAAGVLYALGRAAESAAPDLLDLIARQPGTAAALTRTVALTGARLPNATALVARALDRMRHAADGTPEAFAAVARLFAGFDLYAGPRLVGNPSVDLRTVEQLLREPVWKDAPGAVRRRHARSLADLLGSPRAEVRARALACLRLYADQSHVVWPALVATLAGADAGAARAAVPLFAALKPITDDTANDLVELLADPNPVYAGRAVVALWHDGRLPAGAAARWSAPDAPGEPEWTVPPEIAEELVGAAERLRPLSAPRPAVVAEVDAHLFAPESAEEAAISAHVGPDSVGWQGLYARWSDDPDLAPLFVALLSAFGPDGFTHKIFLIKHQRGLSGAGLGESKRVVERVIDALGPMAPPAERRRCVRDFFGRPPDLPAALVGLLGHRVSWYRWAGLELLDAWGAADGAAELAAARLRDRCERVRRRARRMHDGENTECA